MKVVKRISLATLFSVALVSNVAAQSITLTGPTSPVTTQEGDDYASTVLTNAWDFNERRDIGWEENYSGTQVSVSNGVWHGVSQAGDPYVFPLFQGYIGSLLSEGLPGDKSLPRFGLNHPIDASRYYVLSFRMNQTSRNTMIVTWNNNANITWPDLSNLGARLDGYYHVGAPYSNVGNQAYIFNMHNLAAHFDANQFAGSWSGLVYSFAIHPAFNAPAGSSTDFDWVRLVDPNSAPNLTISWSASGLNSIPHPGPVLSVYYDTDNSGFDGTPLTHITDRADPGNFTFSLATLPPGDYYFYVAAHNPATPSTVYARSGYSARVRIQKAPNVFFSSPTQLSGEEYSTTTGNPWDMSDSSDLDNFIPTWPSDWSQLSNASFPNGVMQATANPPLPGLPHSDVQLHMHIPRVLPIDSNKYRYLTYKMGVDESAYPTLHDKIDRGWVSRPIYWWSDLFGNGGRAKAHIIYEGMNAYTMDMWDSSLVEAGLQFRANPWTAHLRIDPLETTIPTWFYFDYVRLHAEPRPNTDGIFPIEFTVEDSDSATVDVSLYADTDNVGFDGLPITTLTGLAPGAHSYDWHTEGLPAQTRYYVFAVVNDGSHVRMGYSPVPMITGQYVPTSLPPVAPDPLGRNEIVLGTPTLAPKNFIYKGGKVTITVPVSNAVVGMKSVTARVEGGARRVKRDIALTDAGNGNWVAIWTVPSNAQKKKGAVDAYSFKITAVDNGNATLGRRAGKISVAHKSSYKKTKKKK